jgi:hypothetical protein
MLGGAIGLRYTCACALLRLHSQLLGGSLGGGDDARYVGWGILINVPFGLVACMLR